MKERTWFFSYIASVKKDGPFSNAQVVGNACLSTVKKGKELYTYLSDEAMICARRNNEDKEFSGVVITSISCID